MKHICVYEYDYVFCHITSSHLIVIREICFLLLLLALRHIDNNVYSVTIQRHDVVKNLNCFVFVYIYLYLSIYSPYLQHD